MDMSKCVLAGVTAACFFATTAGAVTVGLAATETGYVDGRHAYIDPLTLNGAPWFCISPDLDIALGAQPYVFSAGALTTANSLALTGYSLNSTQIGEIGALIVRGLGDISHGAPGAQIAADASAIWAIEGATVVADNAPTQALILADESWATGRSASFTILTNSSGVQVLGGVPEPASWALMTIGFGGIGLAARRRRGLLV